MKLHDSIKAKKNIQEFYLDSQDIVESSRPSLFSHHGVTNLFFVLSPVALSLKQLNALVPFIHVWVKAICPLVHPPLPVNRVTAVYLSMISFQPPPSPTSVGNIVLFCGVHVITGLQDHGSWDLRTFNQMDNVNSQHKMGVVPATVVKKCQLFHLFSHLSHFCSDSVFEVLKLHGMLMPGITCDVLWRMNNMPDILFGSFYTELHNSVAGEEILNRT